MNGIPFKALFFGKIAETGNAKKDSQTYYPHPQYLSTTIIEVWIGI